MAQKLSWDPSRTLLDAFAEICAAYSTQTAYSQNGQTLSYRELMKLSRDVAICLQSNPHLMPGDRIAIQLPNTLLYPVLAWAVIQAGMVIVNFNPQYTARETLRQMKDAGVKAWFCADISAHLIDEVRREFPIPLIITCRLFELHPWPQRNIFQFVLRYKRKAIRPYSEHNIQSFRSFLRSAGGKALIKPDVDAESIAMIQYTGGSSGELLGAMLSHANLVANMEQLKAFLTSGKALQHEVLIAPLPLYHIFSFTVHCAASLLIGGHNVLILDASSIASVVMDMRRVKFTIITGVNTLFFALQRLDSFKTLDFRQLRFSIAGGMKLDPTVAEKWEAITGSPILEGFGMTELSPVATWNPREKNKLGTIGKALPFTELELRNDLGQRIDTAHTDGELWVRGPQVMLGYWGRKEATRWHMDAQGWMRTGDIARFDEENYWSIVGRKKSMILVSGFNVYPNEVESVLKSHPDVADAMVLGKKHPVNGEVVKAYIVSRNPALTVTDIKQFCKHYLTAYKQPKHIELVAEIPRTREVG